MKLAIQHFESLPSTQMSAKAFALEGAAEGTVIVADTQNEGFGRMGREWQSPSGNLYASVIIVPGEHENAPTVADYGQLGIMTGLAVHAGIREALQLLQEQGALSFGANQTVDALSSFLLKWPNDGLINGKKVFGVVAECIEDAVVIGFGVNVNVIPEVTTQPVTALKAAFGFTNDIDVTAILHGILKSFFKYYRLWLSGGFDGIAKEWVAVAQGLNEMVTRAGGILPSGEDMDAPSSSTAESLVPCAGSSTDATVTGLFVGLAASGAMQLQQADGSIVSVYTVE